MPQNEKTKAQKLKTQHEELQAYCHYQTLHQCILHSHLPNGVPPFPPEVMENFSSLGS